MVALVSHAKALHVGIDLGAAMVKVVVLDAAGTRVASVARASLGRPLPALCTALEEALAGRSLRSALHLAITGSGCDLLAGYVSAAAVNEVVAAGEAARAAVPSARTVIDLGGQFSKWLLLDADGSAGGAVIDFATNGLCAAGSGAFLEQQASRLLTTVEALAEDAARAERGATIAGRCSVFAKSDMIHLQQKATPTESIAYGLCLALARTFVATVMAGRAAAPPVVLVGGGAANAGLVRAFREVLELGPEAVRVPADPLLACASGAAAHASEAPATTLEALWEALARAGATTTASETAALAPLPLPAGPDVRPDEDPPAPDGPVAAYLGVDVGSVSTNVVLLTPALEVLQGIYLPTRGRPMDVLAEGLALVRERFGSRLTVLGVGTTGSGRHLAAQALGADVVHNEITAQAVSAACFVPEVDTIFEIGGQDSKYIGMQDGLLSDFEMNKICAAGTGSFLEEQAQRLGVRIVGEFTERALRGRRPPDLGTRCTVFMDAELVRAQQRGTSVDDLCAGLAYSVARNYLEKVVAGRPVGRCVVFQGGTASNGAVVAAFQALLGRPVHVHPFNRISGAIGAALLAARAREEARSADAPFATRFRGLAACEGATVRTFECRHCENRCQVNRIEVGGRSVHFGDACERYAERDRVHVAAARPFPELFAARERLLERALEDDAAGARDRTPIGLVRASLNLEYLPFWFAFLRSLGYEPVLSGRTTTALLAEHSGGVPAEVCLPIKAASAHVRALLESAPRVFVPAILECLPRPAGGGAHTCLYNQELGDMLRATLGARVVTAQFALEDGGLGLVEPALALGEALSRAPDEIVRALRAGREAQARFVTDRVALGREALSASFERAVVVIGKPYNVHDGHLNLALARHLEQAGLPAIPWDLLPLDGVALPARFDAISWHYNREQLRAVEWLRDDGRLFPVLVSSYGCGPDGFTVKHLEHVLAGRPRLLLEFDEHRGEAGLVTRLEAFADEIDVHRRRHGRAPAVRRPAPPVGRPESARRFFFADMAQHSHIFAAALRSAGSEVTVMPPPDEEALRLGEELSSGRECHPYAIVLGQLVQLARSGAAGEGDVFVFPGCETPCLLREYGDGFRLLLQREGLRGVEVWDPNTSQLGEFAGTGAVLRLYEGLLAVDTLVTLATRLRPYEAAPGRADAMLDAAVAELAATIAARRPLTPAFASAAHALWHMPRTADPGTRPVVGVTGDLYTRIHPVGNGGLYRRLEELGCEVWPSPCFATMNDVAAQMDTPRWLLRGRLGSAAREAAVWALSAGMRRRLVAELPGAVRDLAVEAPAEVLRQLARPHLGPLSNYLLVHVAGKIAHFLASGADGAISAVGINCMVGVSIAGVVPSIRATYDDAPVVSLAYGGSEGPAQRIRLEAFVHQVKARRAAERADGARRGARLRSIQEPA